jgi:DNA-binding NarL/FixJ family response regulator
MAEELLPDIVIMDIAMPNLNGIQATTQIVKKNPQTGVIILSMHSDETYITRALSAGAKGYLLKDNAEVDLFRAVQASNTFIGAFPEPNCWRSNGRLMLRSSHR